MSSAEQLQAAEVELCTQLEGALDVPDGSSIPIGQALSSRNLLRVIADRIGAESGYNSPKYLEAWAVYDGSTPAWNAYVDARAKYNGTLPQAEALRNAIQEFFGSTVEEGTEEDAFFNCGAKCDEEKYTLLLPFWIAFEAARVQ